MSDLKDSLIAPEQFNSRLLRQEERVLELTQRLDNAVGKLVSLAQLVRTSTVANSELTARVAQLEAQVRGLEERPLPQPNIRSEAPPEPGQVQQSEADFGQVISLLKAEDWEQARRAFGRIPASRLHEDPVLQTLVEAAFSLHSQDFAAALNSLGQAQRNCSDPRLTEARNLVGSLADPQA